MSVFMPASVPINVFEDFFMAVTVDTSIPAFPIINLPGSIRRLWSPKTVFLYQFPELFCYEVCNMIYVQGFFIRCGCYDMIEFSIPKPRIQPEAQSFRYFFAMSVILTSSKSSSLSFVSKMLCIPDRYLDKFIKNSIRTFYSKGFY